MSHSYSQDLETIRELAGQPLRYLGILGPRTRASQLLADAQASRGGPLQKLASVDVAGSGVLFDELIQISTVTTIKCRHKAPPLLSV